MHAQTLYYNINKLLTFFTQSENVVSPAIGQHAGVAFEIAIADVESGGGAYYMDIATFGGLTDAAGAGEDEVWESGN